MSRPIPAWPRGPRGLREAGREGATSVLLACPRISPEFELSVVRALMRPKPITRGAVEHRRGDQPWSVPVRRAVMEWIGNVSPQIGFEWEVHLPERGEYYLVSEIPIEREAEARALAVGLSKVIAGSWIVVGRLFAKEGQFYRRRQGYRIEIGPAKDIHVPREIRQRLRGLL